MRSCEFLGLEFSVRFICYIKFSVVCVFASHFTAIPHASMKMCFGIGSKSLCDTCVYAFWYFDFYVRSTLPLFSFLFSFQSRFKSKIERNSHKHTHSQCDAPSALVVAMSAPHATLQQSCICGVVKMWRYTNVAMALLHATATATALHLNCVCACVCVLWLDNAQPQRRGRLCYARARIRLRARTKQQKSRTTTCIMI